MAKSTGSEYALNKLAKLEPENAKLKRAVHTARCELAESQRLVESKDRLIENLRNEVTALREYAGMPSRRPTSDEESIPFLSAN